MSRSLSPSVVKFAVDQKGSWTTTECYHDLDAFIREGLKAEIELTRRLHAFSRRKGTVGKPWREIVEKFCDEQRLIEGFWVHTFNDANLLLPDAVYFQVGDIIILQPHSGQDARVGYLKPKVYRDQHDWLYRNAWAVLCADPQQDSSGALVPSPAWLTQDAGNTWQALSEHQDLTDYAGTTAAKERGRGKLYISENGVGHCPITGGPLRLNTFHGEPNFVA